MVTWALAKQMCGRLQNSIILLGLDFMPLDEIVNMSMNGLRRLFSTCDKTQTRTWMDEPSVALDMGHCVSDIGAPPLSLCFL
jgi:hypothetical protein